MNDPILSADQVERRLGEIADTRWPADPSEAAPSAIRAWDELLAHDTALRAQVKGRGLRGMARRVIHGRVIRELGELRAQVKALTEERDAWKTCAENLIASEPYARVAALEAEVEPLIEALRGLLAMWADRTALKPVARARAALARVRGPEGMVSE